MELQLWHQKCNVQRLQKLKWDQIILDYLKYMQINSEELFEILLEEQIIVIYVRKDLAKKLGIKEITPKYISYKTDTTRIISYYFAKFLVWKDEHKEKSQ